MRASRKAKNTAARIELAVAVRAGKPQIERKLIDLLAEGIL